VKRYQQFVTFRDNVRAACQWGVQVIKVQKTFH
jgi:hypothetical protein